MPADFHFLPKDKGHHRNQAVVPFVLVATYLKNAVANVSACLQKSGK